MNKYQNNLRYFAWFRALFTSRFYYPVYTILFLDIGITIEEFALLNTFWAIVIVVAEVPSGALADTWGRKKLLVATSLLMIVEIGSLLVCPIGRTPWLLPLMVLNRLCSALAEASASGADEALAYDSLVLLDKESEWNKVLSKVSRFSSGFMLVAMLLGGLIYDQKVMGPYLPSEWIIKAPLVLNFITAILCFFVSLRFFECKKERKESFYKEIIGATKLTLETGKWILKSPVILITIIYGLCFDNVIRMFMTISNEYNRIIEIPIAMMGLVGASMSALGLFTPSIATYLTRKFSFKQNMIYLFIISTLSFYFLSKAYVYLGLIPSFVLGACFYILSFMLSYYINKNAPSEKRATVLSFKGLSFNLAYAFIGMVYASYLKYIKEFHSVSKDKSFIKGLEGFYVYLIITFIISYFLTNYISKKHGSCCNVLTSSGES
ncbi:MFS transporter [bacterium]|nr:MFS transporter [bacterium]